MRTENPSPQRIEEARQAQRKIIRFSIIALISIAFIVFFGGILLLVVAGRNQSQVLFGVAIGVILSAIPFFAVVAINFLTDHWLIRFLYRDAFKELLRPYKLPPLDQEFQTFLKNGQAIIIHMILFIPEGWQTEHNIQSVKSIILAAIGNGCSTLNELPSFDAIYQMIDKPITDYSEEQQIPVLYARVASCADADQVLSPSSRGTPPELWT